MKTLIVILALLSLAATDSLAAHADTPTLAPAVIQSAPVKVAVGRRIITAQATWTPHGSASAPGLAVEFELTTWNQENVWFSLNNVITFHVGRKTFAFPAEYPSGGGQSGGIGVERRTARIPLDAFKAIFSAKQVTLTLQHNPTPPFEPGYTETYPFSATALAPFQDFLKALPAHLNRSGSTADNVSG